MISEKQRAGRLRRHEELKGFLDVKLSLAKTDSEKEHLKLRIAEVQRNIDATKLPEVALSEPKALLLEITKPAEEDAEKAEEPIVHPIKQKPAEPKQKVIKIKKVGNPF
jgi:hypothetical protein